MPSSDGLRGRPFRDHRQVIEGIIYRLRTGVDWRDVPESFGPWPTVWKRHRRFSVDGTWDRIHARLVAEADAAGEVAWTVSVDATERSFNDHKQWRVRATRYDKLAAIYRGRVVRRAITLWLRTKGDTPLPTRQFRGSSLRS